MERRTPPRSSGRDTGEQADAVPHDPHRPIVLGGRYTLHDVIGAGSTATVYRARDGSAGEEVAVKLFHADVSVPGVRHQQQELDVLRGLRHRGLVTWHDGGTHRGQAYVVMPLVPGPTLAQRLAQGTLPARETMRLGAEVAEALAYVHDAGITHRDIKPANVLLDPDGAKVGDFGIAHSRDATQPTVTGVVIGTAAYMAPEQVRGEPVGPQADVYALGLVLLECLSGCREYPGGMVESAVARLHRRPTVPDELPFGLDALLQRMTRQNPSTRPTTGELATVLDAPGRTRTLAWTAWPAPDAA